MTKSGTVLIERSRWWFGFFRMFVCMFILALVLPFASSDDPHLAQSTSHQTKFHYAQINISIIDVETKKEMFRNYKGKYGKNSIITSISGVVLHTLSLLNKSGTTTQNNYGCARYINPKFPTEQWIALVERGECPFTNKIRIATKEHNASAIVIYNNDTKESNIDLIPLMDSDQSLSAVSVLLSHADGKEIIRLLEMHHTVHMQIIPGNEGVINSGASQQNSISKTSVLFVSISFIVLMIISLAWLVFYYIQRFRYSHAKERLARRLVCAAKKAIAKIPQRTVKMGDKELDSEFDQCAVCIEPYKAHDVIRILPCRHVFHKSCVDPWLLDQRSCPMCKLDILRAFGMQISGSQESVHPDTGAGTVATVVQEPEISSSVEDTQAEEIKVLLVPHTCLHFRSGHDKAAGDDEEASASLLGATGESLLEASPSSCAGSKGIRHSRAESCSSEMKALIGKGKGKKRKWRSKDECNNEDDEEYDTDDNVLRDTELIMDVIETVSADQNKVKLVNTGEEDSDEGAVVNSSSLSLPPSPSGQLKYETSFADEKSKSGKVDEQDSDSVIITVGDDSAIVTVEFHTDDSRAGMESSA